MEKEPLFPEIRRTVRPIFDEEAVEFFTIIRKKHRGKYYLQRVYKSFVGGEDDAIMHQFLRDVYVAMLFSKVDTKSVNMYGEPMFRLDPDQRSEAERLGLQLFNSPSKH